MTRILLANKFFYPRGGDCTSTIDLEALLKMKGHDVAIFAMQHKDNLRNKYESYFPSEVSYSGETKTSKIKAITRPFGTKEVREKFTRLLDDFQPDIVHLQNIHTQLSPVIARIAHRRNIKVIWTLHDYKLLCHRSDCLRNNIPCELCFTRKINVLKYKCVKNSLGGSLLAYAESMKWNRKVLEKYTNRFICPSFFMQSKMTSGGFNKDKTVVLHNFFQRNHGVTPSFVKEDYYCYIGRLSPEKGIETLLAAAKQLKYPLKIVGGGNKLHEYQLKYKDSNIEFLGFQSKENVMKLLDKALFSVIPSEWYENNPFSVIESLCLGTPVLGADIGGIPELINAGHNGFLFQHGNINDLKDKIELCFNTFDHSYSYSTIAENANGMFSEEIYYQQLLEIYKNA